VAALQLTDECDQQLANVPTKRRQLTLKSRFADSGAMSCQTEKPFQDGNGTVRSIGDDSPQETVVRPSAEIS
jgi:hypothetical protein